MRSGPRATSQRRGGVQVGAGVRVLEHFVRQEFDLGLKLLDAAVWKSATSKKSRSSAT